MSNSFLLETGSQIQLSAKSFEIKKLDLFLRNDCHAKWKFPVIFMVIASLLEMSQTGQASPRGRLKTYCMS